MMDEVSSFLLSVIDSSSDAIIGLDTEGRIISWNPGAEQIYGWPSDEMVGKLVVRLTLFDQIKETNLILKRVLAGERISHFQTYHLTQSQHPIPVSLSVFPVINREGIIVGASFLARDLSHQFSYEKNLHEVEQRYQKLKTSLELAHHIQARLLPPECRKTDRLDIYAKILYSEDVGGDYYDFFGPPNADHMCGLAVGDVTGHGTGAALLMAMAKGVLQTEVEHTLYNLPVAMERLNHFFCRLAEEGLLMTLFLAMFDSSTGDLQWCSSGQGPVYIYHHREQFFEELFCTGVPLGVLQESKFENLSTHLNPGDILIVGTDGLWEARDGDGEMFSVERFRQVLATWYQKSAKEICLQMLARVKHFTGQDELDDDMTLMIIKVPERPAIGG
jgi:PAS domain S-box-containing protein